ncbi:MAG: hypothetical protein IKA02_03775 [Clostridia bacterium]|nr:hypothetical protein [Clostridia bacterium]
MAKINVELEEKIYNEAQGILDEIGLDVESVIETVLKRIVRQGSAEFIFAKTTPSVSSTSVATGTSTTTTPYVSSTVSSTIASTTTTVNMSKSLAKSIFNKRGHNFDAPVVYSSLNKATGNYWANPEVKTVMGKWYLILNDQYNRILRLFKIDISLYLKEISYENSDMENREQVFNRRSGHVYLNAPQAVRDMLDLVPRADKPDFINLQILGNDTVYFRDKISGVIFKPYLIDEVNY